MINISIEAQIGAVENQLEQLQIETSKVNRKILKRLTSRARSKIIRAFKKKFNSSAGITKAIYGSAKNNEAGYVGLGSKSCYKYKLKETGGKIEVRRKKYLLFKVNGDWVKVKRIDVKAQPFIIPTVEAYKSSPQFQRDIEVVVEKMIEKVNKQ